MRPRSSLLLGERALLSSVLEESHDSNDESENEWQDIQNDAVEQQRLDQRNT